jgi:hypothetical protein
VVTRTAAIRRWRWRVSKGPWPLSTRKSGDILRSYECWNPRWCAEGLLQGAPGFGRYLRDVAIGQRQTRVISGRLLWSATGTTRLHH